MVPEQGRSHAKEVERVACVTEESWERGAGQSVGPWGGRQSHARGE